MKIEHIEVTNIRYQDGTLLHKYKCYCGNFFNTLPRSIRNGHTKSCGCYSRDLLSKFSTGRTPANALKDPSESSFNGLLIRYKNSAKFRKLDFAISKEEFRALVTSSCHYCGDLPKKLNIQTKHSRKPFYYNGIDRKDNNKGYLLENCLPCCFECNYAKKAKSYDDFLAFIRKIYLHLKAVP